MGSIPVRVTSRFSADRVDMRLFLDKSTKDKFPGRFIYCDTFYNSCQSLLKQNLTNGCFYNIIILLDKLTDKLGFIGVSIIENNKFL